MPFSVPAILQSMSQKRVFPTDDVGEQFVIAKFYPCRRRSVQMPMLIPATGGCIGTPASISAKVRRKLTPSKWNRWIP